MEKRIALATPKMTGNEREYVKDALDSNWIAPLGPYVTKLENDIKDFYDNEVFTCALASGTAAIHLALILAGVEKDDIVFCQSLTFAASCNPIKYLGATPVFIDSDTETLNMCPKALDKAFKDHKPKAVVAVDLYGFTPKMEEIIEICKKHNVVLIEDSAEALGSIAYGKKAGLFGDLSVLSFNGNKIITTSGGGMLLTKKEEDKKEALFLATQAKEPERHYEHKKIGYNYRLSNISAAIGVAQFEQLDKKVVRKQEIFNRYKEGLKDIDCLTMFDDPKEQVSNKWLSIAILDYDKTDKTALDLIIGLDEANIEARPIWKPMHMQPVYREYEYYTANEGEDISADIFDRGLCLPSDLNMTNEEQDYVIETIKEVLS